MELDSHPYRDRSLMSHFPQVRQSRRGGKACKYRCAECKRRVQAQSASASAQFAAGRTSISGIFPGQIGRMWRISLAMW